MSFDAEAFGSPGLHVVRDGGIWLLGPPYQTTRRRGVPHAFVYLNTLALGSSPPCHSTRRRWTPCAFASFDTSVMGPMCLRVVHNGGWATCASVSFDKAVFGLPPPCVVWHAALGSLCLGGVGIPVHTRRMTRREWADPVLGSIRQRFIRHTGVGCTTHPTTFSSSRSCQLGCFCRRRRTLAVVSMGVYGGSVSGGGSKEE